MRLKFGIFTLLMVGAILQMNAQETTWKTLAKITYTKQYDELMGFKVDVPVFSEDIKALDGIGIWGCVIGKALYEGVIDIKDFEK